MNKRINDIIATAITAMLAVYVTEKDNLDELKERRRREAERRQAVLEALRRASRPPEKPGHSPQEGRTPSDPTHGRGRTEKMACRAL
ncbi:MAG TPA: hypothetical protein VLI39_20645 [Sedimentisphaerales bacterium]|nr:hypothetical protein [Sedimentisphaerales bacterium]